MNWHSLPFLLHETRLNLRRERFISLGTLAIAAIALCLLGAAGLLALNLNLWTRKLAGTLEIRAYVRKDVSRQEALALRDRVARWPVVGRAWFVSREEGFEWLKERLAAGEKLEGVPNRLPDMIGVKPVDPGLLPMLAEQLGRLPQIEELRPDPAQSRRLDQVTQMVLRLRQGALAAAGALSGLMLLATFLMVYNAVRLALAHRWAEISIMQLVGATNRFVATPFLLEGIHHGFFGALAACAVLLPGYWRIRVLSGQAIPLLLLWPERELPIFAAALLGTGTIVGFLASALAVRRFLHHRQEWRA